MKRLWLVLCGGVLLIALLFSSTAVFAQTGQGEELQLPDAGILPDNPLYVFDNMGKSIGLFFTSGSEAKAQKALKYAGERLVEAQAMATKGKANGVEKAVNGYDKFVTMAADRAEEARQKGVSANISEAVALAISKHLSVLDKVAESFPEAVPEQARQAISQAKEASMKGTENALKGLAQENPGRAADIAMNAAEARLNHAKGKAEKNDTQGVGESINETGRLFEFGAEISAIAQGLGKGETTVDQIIARATSMRLDVLAEIYQKVPEQAKSAIEGAMTRAVTARENAVERLQGAGALGNITEKLPIPQGIPGDVKDKLENIIPSKPSTPAGRRP